MIIRNIKYASTDVHPHDSITQWYSIEVDCEERVYGVVYSDDATLVSSDCTPVDSYEIDRKVVLDTIREYNQSLPSHFD